MTTNIPIPPNETSPRDEAARRLEALVLRSAAFVDEHLVRLCELTPPGPTVVGADSDDGEAAWRQEQADWERKRAAEEARIDEQLDHLTKAWRDLEVEQRRLMMLGQVPAGHTNEQQDTTNHPVEPPATEAHRPNRSLDLDDAADLMSASSAAFQFQRLKREIRQQSQRRR